jgi:3-polyprenyl-4-hydroxybenzoate decarboxylase
MNKLIVAVTGASGSVYAKTLFDNLQNLSSEIDDIAIVMSDNAKQVWEHELGNKDYDKYLFKFYDKIHLEEYEKIFAFLMDFIFKLIRQILRKIKEFLI